MRQKLLNKDDDWQWSLINTFREYCRAIGINRPSSDPIQVMHFQLRHAIEQSRGVRAGSSKPHGHTLSLAYAAAAVKALTLDHGRKAAAAISEVAKATGFDKQDVQNFYHALSRDRAPKEAPAAYNFCLTQMREWSADVILASLSGISIFVE
ncbi:hypothetical protein D3227_35140 [Mesorhizobium waimense]|uniref:Uncharacterized protein n=1 Tax=Mesorhizobium waimense TaxID=1300307 RepID=A0A3A5K0Y7_9HYPH|nr:hypothetical protein D3227_35140 [Mesorhizobium waimense]